MPGSQPPMELRIAAAARSRKAHPERVNARNRVQRAIKAGMLVRPGCCARCQVSCKPEASHDDYNKPLEIEWLCKTCHARKDAKDRPHGEASGRARLTSAQVIEIRRSDESARSLARRFGVSSSTVDSVRAGRSWRHLLEET